MNPALILMHHWARQAFQAEPRDWQTHDNVLITRDADGGLCIQTATNRDSAVTISACGTRIILTYGWADKIDALLASVKLTLIKCSHLGTVRLMLHAVPATILTSIVSGKAVVDDIRTGLRAFTVELSGLQMTKSQYQVSDLLWIDKPIASSILYQDAIGQILRPCQGRTNVIYIDHIPIEQPPNYRRFFGGLNVYSQDRSLSREFSLIDRGIVSLWEAAVSTRSIAYMLYHHIATGLSAEALILVKSLQISQALARVFIETNGPGALPNPDVMHFDLYAILKLSLGTMMQNLVSQADDGLMHECFV